MARFRHPLRNVQVAAPCTAEWDQMIGSEQVRFCGQCNLNVYNLSGMRRSDAEALITRTEGRLCVKFYRRRDGSIISKDCPVGLEAVHRRVTRVAQAIFGFFLAFLATVGLHELFPNGPSSSGGTMGVMALPEVQGQVIHTTVGMLIEDPPKRKLRRRSKKPS